MAINDDNFGKIMLGVVLIPFGMWWRPFACLGMWDAHAVPIGAPAVGFWWMFWLLTMLGAVIHVPAAGKESFTGSVVRSVFNHALLGAIWLVTT